jgi:exodeoxyribonuclease V beta subunit
MSELGLQLPLNGVQLIEASAGTGKTHTLATLYARLVIEARLEVPQLLAVTYTRAATAELRERLRRRLQQALARAESVGVGMGAGAGASTSASAGDGDGEGAARSSQTVRGEPVEPPPRGSGIEPPTPLALSSHEPDPSLDALIAAALEREPLPSLVARLRRAVAAMDLAPIHTIHAFCQRALADFALEAGQAPIARSLITNERELQLEVATEFWRAQSRDDAGARTLDALARSPRALAVLLR